MSSHTDVELIERYKSNYNIPDDAEVTIEMINAHWELEQQLREDLLNSTPDNRWEVFEKAYTDLYDQLGWLNELSETHDNIPYFKLWLDVIGEEKQEILEIGSGKGELITFLAEHGHQCKATEVTRERGEKWVDENVENLTWGTTDGIHLTNFEPENHYDIVLSNQVVEHMHPDDIPEHLAEVYKILKPGGRYILSTPHAADGPTDVTRVFGHSDVRGMHLKEYTYGELDSLLSAAGFKTAAVMRLPKKVREPLAMKPAVSNNYLKYLIRIEKWLLGIDDFDQRQKTVKRSKAMLFTGNIMMVGKK